MNVQKSRHFSLYSPFPDRKSQIANLKSKIVTLFQIGGCAADK
jgi:hypothetical protein